MSAVMPKRASTSVSQVPSIAIGFWTIKIAAATLGKTGGDRVSMPPRAEHPFGDLGHYSY